MVPIKKYYYLNNPKRYLTFSTKMSSCPWCGSDMSRGHSMTNCYKNPNKGKQLSQQSDFSAAIGLQAVSGKTVHTSHQPVYQPVYQQVQPVQQTRDCHLLNQPAVRVSHNGHQTVYIQTPPVVYCNARGCTSCTTPGQKHYCNVCGDRNSTHRARDCHMLNQHQPLQVRFAPTNVSPHGGIGFVLHGAHQPQPGSVRFAPTNVSPQGGIGFVLPNTW